MAKKYVIKVETNPTFCGIDAGGVQFANGQAVIDECPLVEWFRTHEGYSVAEADPLASMTVAELKAYAAEKEIDLGEYTKKADIIAVIKNAAE
ncbi:hypothetical protein AALA22_11695 [Anaerovoracaceae bacterium 41-7]